VIRVAVLLGGLVAVTALGIGIGLAVEPSSTTTAATTTPAATRPGATTPAATTAPNATTITISKKPAPPPHTAGSRDWGPLPVAISGSFPAGGAQAGAALAGTTLVVAGGKGSSRVLSGPRGGDLKLVASLPGPRTAPLVFAIGTTVYVIGGEAADTPTDEIHTLAAGAKALTAAGTFEEPLAESGVVTSGGSAYFVGGWTGSKYGTAILKFTPPNSSVLLARLPDGVRSPAVALIGHTIYVAGGRTSAGVSAHIYAVDISSGAVTSIGELPQPVQQAVLVAHGTKLYLLGGLDAQGDPVHSVVSIDPATGRPSAAGRMVHDLPGAAAPPTATGALVVDPPSGKVFRVG
jgi:hypothetical protein